MSEPPTSYQTAALYGEDTRVNLDEVHGERVISIALTDKGNVMYGVTSLGRILFRCHSQEEQWSGWYLVPNTVWLWPKGQP